MADGDAVARAAEVLKATRYLVLATADEAGVWTAALAYTLAGHDRFYFVSQTTSRHGAALAQQSAVAGVIFDSRADQDAVESIQFSGVGELVKDVERIRALLLAGGATTLDEEEVRRLAQEPSIGLFEVVVGDAYVLDQVAWADRGVDAREVVDFSAAVGGVRTT
jgi:hypothetical protein